MDNKNSIKMKIEKQEDYIDNENSEYCFLSEAIQRKNENQAVLNKKQTSKHNSSNNGDKVKYFECNKCNKKCLSKKDMIKHWRNHDMEIYKCTQCDRAFVTKNSLSYHLKSHAGIKYECDICKRQFNDKSNMKKHRNIHLNIQPYKCTKCPKAFTDRTCFKTHMERHAGIRFKCTFCDKTYAHRQYLKLHLMRHVKGDDKLFPCDQCKDTCFKYKAQLEKHQNKHHLDIEYKCHHCPKVLHHKTSMRSHLYLHTNEFLCTHKGCGKRFTAPKRLMNHIEARHENNFLHCIDCGKMFRSNFLLSQHRKIVHPVDRPHVCSICGKLFATKHCLQKHDKCVHGNIMYKCAQCSFKSKHKISISFHIKNVHFNLKVQRHTNFFECAMCMKIYRKKSDLRDHIMSAHLKTNLLLCDLCDFSSYRQYGMQKHKRVHPSIAYHCKHCRNKFTDVELFKSHLSDHLVKCIDDKWKEHVAKFRRLKVFKCNSCNERFTSAHLVKTHINYMHCNGTHKCQYCNTSFVVRHDLNAHIHTFHRHTTSTNYKCAKCDRGFKSYIGINHHIETGNCFDL
ncbi:hypothetical protein WDU94_000075 [Cyamophila willieti]